MSLASHGLFPIANPTRIPTTAVASSLSLSLSLSLQVACGGYHSAVATDAGRVFTWGFNRYGQCGNGSKDNTVPEPSLVDLSLVTPGAVGEVPKVLCGRHHSALVTRGGALYTWGACSFGKASAINEFFCLLPLEGVGCALCTYLVCMLGARVVVFDVL